MCSCTQMLIHVQIKTELIDRCDNVHTFVQWYNRWSFACMSDGWMSPQQQKNKKTKQNQKVPQLSVFFYLIQYWPFWFQYLLQWVSSSPLIWYINFICLWWLSGSEPFIVKWITWKVDHSGGSHYKTQITFWKLLSELCCCDLEYRFYLQT